MRRLSPPGWAWVLILIGAGLLELVLVRTGNRTLSQWVQRHTRAHWWARAAVIGVLALFAWHLVAPAPDPPPEVVQEECEGENA